MSKQKDKDKKEKFTLEVAVYIGDHTRCALGFDLNTLKEPLTERKFEELLLMLRVGVARCLGDLGKIVNPGVWD